MLAVICPICPFIAEEGSLRNRNKFDLLTEDDKPMQMLVKNPVFLYFAVDDPFNSEMNATAAVISRCPFHIRVQTWMGPVRPRHPRPGNVPTVSQIPLLLICGSGWWSSFYPVETKKKVPVRALCMGNILCSTCGLQPNQLYSPFAHLP